jgi:hypothetical protein
MKKAAVYLLGVLFASCNLFEKQERLIQTIKSTNGKHVKIYFVGLGATTNDVVQVRKVDNDGNETLAQAYEHNFLDSARFITADSLLVVLSDTSIYGKSKKMNSALVVIK